MLARPLLCQVTNDALTRNLGDAEGRILVEWLADRAEEMVSEIGPAAEPDVLQLCRRARAVACFVHLWCYRNDRPAAVQLAATERFPFPLPIRDVEPWQLMHVILNWEAVRLEQSRAQAA